MKYMMLIYQGDTPRPPSPEWDQLPEEEKAAVYVDNKALNETPGVTSGQHLQLPELANTVCVKDGRPVTTDGPYPETKQALSGYLYVEADDLDAAIAVAAKIPAARMGGAIEIRPIAEW